MIQNPANSGNAGESLHPFFDDVIGSGDSYLDITGTEEEIDAAYNLSLKADATIFIGLGSIVEYGADAVLFVKLCNPRDYRNEWTFDSSVSYTNNNFLGYGSPNFIVTKTSSTSLRISTTTSWVTFGDTGAAFNGYSVKF